MFDSDLVYLDNHSTTRCDPRVVEVMLPLLTENYGNVHSVSHEAGRSAADVVQQAMTEIANAIGAQEDEIVITSGATESNNLALRGLMYHPRQKRRRIITVSTEHRAVLDPIKRLESEGFHAIYLPVYPQGHIHCGKVDLEQLESLLDDDTAVVSVMLANNEIGVLQDIQLIAELCHKQGTLLHCDATQAVGRMPVDVEQLGVDLLSASAHKFYGPKGVGVLYVRRRGRRVRLVPMIDGGGQQNGLRSGTINSAGIVAMGCAIRLCDDLAANERRRIDELTKQLWDGIRRAIPDVKLNGPNLEKSQRLIGNLNICFPHVEGAALMAACPSLALSSGSACSSLQAGVSHVLTGIGLSELEARQSVRIGVGRFNTQNEIELAVHLLTAAHARLID